MALASACAAGPARADDADLKRAIAVLQQQRNAAWDAAAEAQLQSAKLSADLDAAKKALDEAKAQKATPATPDKGK